MEDCAGTMNMRWRGKGAEKSEENPYNQATTKRLNSV